MCAAMWHGLLRWPYHQLSGGMLVGPTSWLSSLVCGPHVLTWTIRRVTHGSYVLTWITLILSRVCISLSYFIRFVLLLSPNLHPDSLCP
jgi:hypothetical protein